MKNSPFFSVILNTYNSEKTINKTLSSVLNQTFKNFELIIVDDNSFDKTLCFIMESLANTNLKYRIYPLKKNKGISHSRNLGIDMAKGKYITFIDGDDIWRKDKLKKQYEFLISENCLVDWTFSNYSVINSKYQVIGKRVRKPGYYDYDAVIGNGNPVGMLTVAVKSTLIKEEKFRNVEHEDYDLWIRLTQKGIMGFLINDSLAFYMKHNGSLSSNKLKSALWTFRIFRTNNISFIRSLYLLMRYMFNAFMRKDK